MTEALSLIGSIILMAVLIIGGLAWGERRRNRIEKEAAAKAALKAEVDRQMAEIDKRSRMRLSKRLKEHPHVRAGQ